MLIINILKIWFTATAHTEKVRQAWWESSVKQTKSNGNKKIGHNISIGLGEERDVWYVIGELDFWIGP